MRPILLSAVLALLVGTVTAASDKPSVPSCESFGTKVEFVDSPAEAARLAKPAEKLVFVLHVSGHFEDPRFT